MASPMPAGSAALPAGDAATWRLLETKGPRFADIPAAQPLRRRREGEQRVDQGRRDADDHDPGNGQEPRTGRRMSAAPALGRQVPGGAALVLGRRFRGSAVPIPRG
jgi:hypothetical protein